MRSRRGAEAFVIRQVWLTRAIGWSVQFANHGPRWMPMNVRKVPLRACCMATQALVWSYFKGA